MSSNGGVTWTDIVDDANYSGSTTSTLTIAEATIDMDGNDVPSLDYDGDLCMCKLNNRSTGDVDSLARWR